MPVPPRETTVRLPLLAKPEAVSTGPSPLEDELIQLFDQFRNRLLRYLISLGLTPQDGEEIIQETFLALFRHLRQGKSRENLPGWIFRVAHNLGLKRRYASRETTLDPSSENLAGRQVDQRLNPEEQVAARQRQARLLAVVGALRGQDRCCLHLRAEGLRYREIAGVLGMSLGAVALSLERSLARLRRADER